MGNLRACFVVAISALAAACGDDGGGMKVADASVDSAPDAKIFMDAPPPMFDLTCIGNNPPTNAPANIDLAGTAQIVDGTILNIMISPIDMAQINVCTTTACTGNPPSDDSDAAGDWAVADVPTTNNMGLSGGYLELTKTNVRTTFVYPGVPFAGDQAGIPILVFGAGIQPLLTNQGCDAGEPIMAVAVSDCANMPITDTGNVDIVVKQGGNVVAGVEVTDLSSLPGVPAQAAGLFLVCNVPANAATNIGATYNGMTLLAHDVKTVNNTTTTTLVRPGY